jgi:hypothetical protein
LTDCAVHCFSLVCGEEALTQRLRRDIATGLRENDVLPRSLARLPMYNALDTAKIDVSDISAATAAQMILNEMKVKP